MRGPPARTALKDAKRERPRNRRRGWNQAPRERKKDRENRKGVLGRNGGAGRIG